jgi:hypothetical protein
MIITYTAVKYEKTYRVCTLMRRPHLSPPVDGCDKADVETYVSTMLAQDQGHKWWSKV